ncbi:ATP-binding cassette domain-containing protein [Conexibacter sp. JD483]|uniref:ABC transporter ATP-binding protein n=1 Tax=unclassified Conexibacter TaxID=2627773 RepID=UPI002721CFC1|nr:MULTISPECIES: ATP-binding cassette domain-containing protein [unclassified Conexibacter]MDO8188988.1 ATP-binding cassette domain-containing protein [Conexibacter sp. CPCC 205706]MDO8201800.1 ATP-binding cassette domain-containing protein [Conexibacter sp. CPCC 205762]MDR9371511.1 ATP-binding cassette domain-containing protein [Conexibacter sp. JD483]
MAHPGVPITADGLGVDGARGAVFAGVTLRAEAGALVAVAGPGGSGRTSLLLTLAGRMKPAHGSATVAGEPLPQRAGAVRRLVRVARAAGAVELQERWTVQEAIDLQEVLRGHRIDAREAAAVLDACGVSAEGAARIEDLDPRQLTRLAVALAWFERPPAVVLDDLDRGLSADGERELWTLLKALAEQGTTVVASAADAAPAAGLADVVVPL